MDIVINNIVLNRSLVDGPGVRTVVFLQGCNLCCKGCHNRAIWDINDGTKVEVKKLAQYLKTNVTNKKITISGGEPLMQKDAVLELLNNLPDFDIVLYTGHEIAEVPKDILEKLNYIKTGPYIEELRTTTKPYVGSTNQVFRRLKNDK